MREGEIVELLTVRNEQGMEELLTHYGPLIRKAIPNQKKLRKLIGGDGYDA